MNSAAAHRLGGLVLGVVLGALLASQAPIGPPLPGGPIGLDAPVRHQVRDWPAAAALAGVPLYRPSSAAGAPELIVRGIPGDRSRPVTATWGHGLELIQAHRDVLPGPDHAERIEIRDADEAWRARVHERDYLYVRRGETLLLLSGRPDADLLAIAAQLEPVSP